MPNPDDPQSWIQLTPTAVAPGSVGFVWGNCQAESIRRMIAPVAADHGVRFFRLPPVFEMSPAQVEHLHTLLPLAGVLVTQPVKDTYPVPGCGSRELIGLLPPQARSVTVPSTHYEGLFPWQVSAHDAAQVKVDAPLVDYHDLRLLDAAARGWDIDRALEHVAGARPDPAAITALAEASLSELRRRNADLDIDTADAVLAAGPEAMWTVNHPSNAVLGALGRAVLSILGWPGEPAVPEHQMLGRIRTPLPPAVLDGLDLPVAAARPTWTVQDEPLGWQDVARAALALYRRRPDLVAPTVERHQDRLHTLGVH